MGPGLWRTAVKLMLVILSIPVYPLASSTSVSSGKFEDIKCSYDRNSQTVTLNLVLPKESDVTDIHVMYCQSTFENNFCGSNQSLWINATCNSQTFACTMTAAPHSKYRVKITLQNKFAVFPALDKSFDFLEECDGQKPVIKSILFISFEKLRVSWRLPSGSYLASLKVMENSSSRVITEMGIHGRERSVNIDASLEPCSWYTVCIRLLWATSATTCQGKRTDMKYDIEPIKIVRLAENSVKNTVEISWMDPTEETKGPFYYSCKLHVIPKTKPGNLILHNTTRTMLSIPRPVGTQVIFTIQKCTYCGCANSFTKYFPLEKGPEPSARVSNKRKSNVYVWVAAGGAVVVLAIILIGCFVCWYRRKQSSAATLENSTYQTVEDSPDQILPLNHYEEVV